MMKRAARHVILVAGGLTAFAMPCFADDADSIRYPEDRWRPVFLQAIEDGPDILSRDLPVPVDPPPANNSPRTRYELETLRAYKGERTEETVKRIVFENQDYLTTEDFFEDVIELDYLRYPQTVRLMGLVMRDVTFFVFREKHRFMRPRPSQLADDLDLVIENPLHAAYPSGHATQMYSMALVLSALDPARKDVYIKAAFDIARRREIAGVHYPSDSMAGFRMAEFLVAELMRTPEIQEILLKAQAEFSTH